jgi:hypothetical protein
MPAAGSASPISACACSPPRIRRKRAIAAELDRHNEERRRSRPWSARRPSALRAQGNRAVILVAAPGWHPGVIGIVAGRLKEKLGRPAIVIALGEDGIGKGSGRSIAGVDLGAAVLAAKDSGLLIAGGGHAMAAGLTVAGDRIDALADFLDERLAATSPRPRRPRLLLDAVLAPGGVCPACATRSRRAAPMAPAGRAARRRRPGADRQGRRGRQRPSALIVAGDDGRSGSRRSPSGWPTARSARRCSPPAAPQAVARRPASSATIGAAARRRAPSRGRRLGPRRLDIRRRRRSGACRSRRARRAAAGPARWSASITSRQTGAAPLVPETRVMLSPSELPIQTATVKRSVKPMHQLSRIAFEVPVLAAAQKGRRSAESRPKVTARASASAIMSATIQVEAGSATGAARRPDRSRRSRSGR